MSILLADDDVDLARFLSRSLGSEGYDVHTAVDEGAVLVGLQRQSYQLIILDLNFGKTDGLKLLERLRSQGVSIPVIILSARNKVSDRIQSLNLGADDYLTKPFSFQELAARANALLRRKADPSLKILRVEDLQLDPLARKVTRDGREVKLSVKEFDLLHLLMKRAGNEVTRQELLQEVWGAQPGSDSNLVDVYVNYLRRKIEHFVASRGEERIDEDHKLIHTVRGVGYRVGREAPTSGGVDETAQPSLELLRGAAKASHGAEGPSGPELPVAQQTPWRALVRSVAHDLAQPLTGVRCFLEVATLRKESLSSSSFDFKSLEQQADRAIVLTKTISALVREASVPAGPWISLTALLEQIFDDFSVLLQSGLLTLERNWDAAIQVTSSPVLQQMLVVLVGKLAGKTPRPITLAVLTCMKGTRCHLEMDWRASEQESVHDAATVLGGDLAYVQEMAYSIGGEIAVDGDTRITLKLPASVHQPPAGFQPPALR